MEAGPHLLQPLPQKVLCLCVKTNKATCVCSLEESFLSQGMIDFHLNENREAVMCRMNETKALVFFSNHHQHFVRFVRFYPSPYAQLLSASV